MDATKSGEFFTALQNIEREIIAKLRERGVPVTAANFKWNRGGGALSCAPRPPAPGGPRHLAHEWWPISAMPWPLLSELAIPPYSKRQ